MKKYLQINILRKYLLSYILIFLVPTLILGSLIQFRFQNLLRDELIQNNRTTIEKLQASIDSELSKFDSVTSQLVLNGFAHPFDQKTNSVHGMHLIQFLNTCKNINPFLSDIIILYNTKNFFYSSTSSYSPELFYSLYGNTAAELENPNLFFDSPTSLHTIPKALILPTMSRDDLNAVMIHPVSTGISRASALLFFVFSEDKLQNLCSQYFDPSVLSALILNENGELLASYGDFSDSAYSHYTAYQDSAAPASSQIQTINQTDYLISVIQSPVYGWSYVTYTQVNAALATSIHFRMQMIYLMIFVLLLGGLLIAVIMYHNFLPLYELINLSNRLTPEQKMETNELVSIKNTIRQLSTENIQLSVKLDGTKIAAKEYIISQLLTGRFMKREFLEKSLVQTILSPNYSRYTVFMIQFRHPTMLTNEGKTQFINEIESFSNEDMIFLCKEDNFHNTFVTISLMSEHAASYFEDSLNAVKKHMKLHWEVPILFGVGTVYNQMDLLAKSYMEANTALDYRFIKGVDEVIFFSSIQPFSQNDIFSYPYEELQQFRLALARGETADVENTVKLLSSTLSNKAITLFQAKSICQDIIYIVTKAIPEGFEQNEAEYEVPNIFSISQFESINDIISLVHQLSYDICKHINSSYDSDNQILLDNIKTFIADKCFDCNFSLQMLSDYFRMAGSNLTTFYKDHTGENIFDTVTTLRMERAKVLLTTTDIPVQQISVNVGYDNVSSFIRRFKQLHSITPGAFREANRSISLQSEGVTHKKHNS